ncbi:hypothetical protein [Lentzea flava]|uniref:hypothetical protein n=1 Tax=Lentzea flava TaxID=103732 RepID=UPI001670F94E|nr:hypothetical protein [Lentzea flava]
MLWLERHDDTQLTTEEYPLLEPRPRPLRAVATWVGLITALVSWLVGSGLLTTGQADSINDTVAAVLALLGAFGVALTGEARSLLPLTHATTPAAHSRRFAPTAPNRAITPGGASGRRRHVVKTAAPSEVSSQRSESRGGAICSRTNDAAEQSTSTSGQTDLSTSRRDAPGHRGQRHHL